MIPIGTDIRLRKPPIGNWALVGVNVLVFVLVNKLGVRFVEVMLPPLHSSVPTLYEYISYQFRHGDFWHLAGNMLFLWVFGNAVCDRMGSVNYVIFYLAGGVFAGWIFAATNSNTLVGASGAISAVTTAFLVLFPRVHITILIWVIVIFTIQLPAMVFIIFKIILWDNVIAPSFDQSGVYSHVGYAAHLGGYAFGALVALGMLAFRGLPRTQFDLLALWSRWRRRTGIASELSFEKARGARPIIAREIEARPIESIKLTPAEQCREDILDRISEHDMAEAARLYEGLIETDAECVLPRSQQLELGNFLAQSRRHETAARVYEDFLSAYPNASDAAQVRLYVGLICRRYIRDAVRAEAHLRAALAGLSLESQRQMAQQELDAALADISGPKPDPPDP
jgi:membrane associated rhomboid family serine protease